MHAHGITRRGLLAAAGTTAAAGTLGLGAGAEGAVRARARAPMHRVDVLVCGGGPAGMAAGVTAARLGARTLLIERYGRLGGMAVHALVGPLMGRVKSPFVSEVLKRVGGHAVDWERQDLEYASLLQEAGAELLLHTWAAEPLMERGRVAGARALSKEGPLEIRAAVTVDATGDGDVAWMAGAPFEQGRAEDGLLQPMSIMYRIAGVEEEKALLCGSEEEAERVHVPEGSWADVVRKGQSAGELPESIGVIRLYRTRRKGERGINATQINGLDGTRAADLTRAELEGRRQAYQVLDFLKKHAVGFEGAYVSAMPAVVGVRETRRFLGTAYLTREDVISGRKRPDAVVHNADFVVDIHNPAGGGQAEGFAAKVKPYDIPYGCLVPRALDGLMLAGRCISGSHDAHASYRVQCIAMATGAAAGTAAALAAKGGVQPRKVDVAAVRRALGLAE